MIYEYALEPAVLSSWASNDRDYAESLREYGLGTPRIISSFPMKKASKLRSYLLRHSLEDSQSLTGRRYTEMVSKLVESIVVREVQDHQAANWQEAAVIENRRVPFDVILSSTEIEEGNNITPSSMYSQGSIWNHPDQLDVLRTNAGLLSAVSNLIRLAENKIVIIDPYGWTAKAVNFIRFMLQSITRNRVADRFPAIMLFYKEKRGNGNSGGGSPSADHVRHQILQGLAGDSSNLQVQVFELRETDDVDVFHNRCILTEHGGVMIGHGISVSGEESHTDEAILMRPDIYQKKWRQFVELNYYEVASEA
ncbi:hypothetical protein M5U04_18230 [Xenorhabdus sp. XENO-1]|uniref:hypothetical protein n=1 Tax=Xenorhabdus bovienii TaxID=40576 RepID=UPI0020CA5276|nr:hypothetical protein [Xenorhabdus bovienii]MCP9269966.1 hypothetical protein [Xenorhabdus bovienii subsp. africana]